MSAALNADPSFHFELLRALSASRYGGADISDILGVAATIVPGQVPSFSTAFQSLAERVKARADSIDAAKNPVSARDAYFAAATYFRNAEFYLHGNPADPQIAAFWKQQTDCFDKALALLPIPGERLTLRADGFDVPAIYYRCASEEPAPTIIAGSGFDGTQEELLHVFGIAALERGFHFLSYEGPGQPTVLYEQQKGFIHDWEKVLSPVVDWALTRPEIDGARLGLVGWSMGGYLSVRAAAYEHRLACVAAVDGVIDMRATFLRLLTPAIQQLYEVGERDGFNKAVQAELDGNRLPTSTRWAIGQGLWSFRADTPFDFIDRSKLMTLRGGVTDALQCPVWVGEAAEDLFFEGQGQAKQVAELLGDRATLAVLTAEDGAAAHCHPGAFSFANHVIFDWMNDIFTK